MRYTRYKSLRHWMRFRLWPFFLSSRRRHTRCSRDWSSDVCSSDLWLRMIGRLRPGASIDGMAPRLTGVLRQWIQNDSGYPANWMEGVIGMLPKQVLNVIPVGAGVAVIKEEDGHSLRILFSLCGAGLLIACANVANLLLPPGVARPGQL